MEQRLSWIQVPNCQNCNQSILVMHNVYWSGYFSSSLWSNVSKSQVSDALIEVCRYIGRFILVRIRLLITEIKCLLSCSEQLKIQNFRFSHIQKIKNKNYTFQDACLQQEWGQPLNLWGLLSFWGWPFGLKKSFLPHCCQQECKVFKIPACPNTLGQLIHLRERTQWLVQVENVCDVVFQPPKL